jgi:glutamate carboxypeptidase
MKPLDLLDYFQDKKDLILNSILEFVRIESPSRDVAGSSAVVDFIENDARKISNGFEIERIRAENIGEHFILRAFENTGAENVSQNTRKRILLLGHTDTVHPRGSFDANPTRIEDGKLFGCGVFDMKANCVLILEILRAFVDLNLKPARPITVLLSCDEEVGSPTGREFVEREARRAEFCLVCEPSANGRVKTGRKGTGNYVLKTRGVPAHAGLEPERGASAILEIARQIEQIHALNDSTKGTTANVCLIGGGTASNVIPEYATCAVDVRFTSVREAERVEREIKNLKGFDQRVSLEITGAINRPPLERTKMVINLYEKARTIAAQFGYDLNETQVGGASDGNFVGALGVPVLDGLGIAGDGAHTLEEFVFVEDIPKRAALLAAFLLDGRKEIGVSEKQKSNT